MPTADGLPWMSKAGVSPCLPGSVLQGGVGGIWLFGGWLGHWKSSVSVT